ncbi:unnamed protein product [Strongylus vulgaris]|uniref:Uncharacterized protein n=1 Tax=Strongylus vulgaris TaxID=40348 RepID=A0A3P7LGA5_STRVU|nr:unnamed protein product [Strongylus vulgaris]
MADFAPKASGEDPALLGKNLKFVRNTQTIDESVKDKLTTYTITILEKCGGEIPKEAKKVGCNFVKEGTTYNTLCLFKL